MTKFIVETVSNSVKNDLEKCSNKVGKPRSLDKFYIIDTDMSKEDIEAIPGVIIVEEEDVDDPEDFIQLEPDNWFLPYLCGDQKDFKYDKTGKNTDIYIMDSGVRPDHKDFNGRVTTVFSYDGHEYGHGVDGANHGTACASCAAGRFYGVAKEANIMNVRYNWSTLEAVKAFDAVLDHHINKGTGNPSILSMSFSSRSKVYKDVLKELFDHGVICVASAGNSGKRGVRYPAMFDFVIAISANDRNNNPAWFTNYGPDCNIFAPGVDGIVASMHTEDSVESFSGTSASAPVAAGVASLMAEGRNIRYASQVRKIEKDLYDKAWKNVLNLDSKYHDTPNLVVNTNL